MRGRKWRLPISAAVMMAAACSAADAQMAGWTAKQSAQRAAAFADLTPQDFARTIRITDDDLEPIANLTTENGYRYKGAFTDTMRPDTFLRALVNKQTGRVIYQLYAHLSYTGPYRHFISLHVASGDGPIALPATLSHHETECSYGSCIAVDDLAFELPERIVREVAAAATTQSLKPWRFRLKAANSFDWTDDMAPAEAAGLLLAVDAWRMKGGAR